MGQRNNQANAQPGAYSFRGKNFQTFSPMRQPQGAYDPNVSYPQGMVPTNTTQMASRRPQWQMPFSSSVNTPAGAPQSMPFPQGSPPTGLPQSMSNWTTLPNGQPLPSWWPNGGGVY